jgi:hypothetical protein
MTSNMKYEIRPINMNGDFLWEVHETATDHTIDRFFFEEDAADLAEALESGFGFNGWTPRFVLNKVVLPDDINSRFSNTFQDYDISL